MKKNMSFIIWASAVMFAAVLWSLDWTLIRPNFYSYSPITLVFLEHLLWALVLSPFLFLWFRKLKSIKKKDIFSLVWVSVFWWLIWTLAITEAFFSAYEWKTTISTVIILQKLQPIFALFLASIVLKEKLDKNFYIWAGIAVFSAYFIAFWWLWQDIFNTNFLSIPAFYALIAAFAFWSSTVFWKNLVDDLGFELSAFLRFFVTSILAWILFFSFWSFWDIWNLSSYHIWLLVLIVFTSWAWWLFIYYYWLKKITAQESTIFELAWPLSAVLFDYIFNWNVLNPVQIVFSLILLLSFYMIVFKKKVF